MYVPGETSCTSQFPTQSGEVLLLSADSGTPDTLHSVPSAPPATHKAGPGMTFVMSKNIACDLIYYKGPTSIP